MINCATHLVLFTIIFCLAKKVSSTLVTAWEEDIDVEAASGGIERINPRVTGCLPKSVYDSYPMLVIPYGPITEWPLDGAVVNITLPLLESAHSASENQKVKVVINKVENLLHGDRSSRSICPASVKQACFWAWSARPSLVVTDITLRSGDTTRGTVIRLRRHLETDNYAHAHENLFRYFREPFTAIRSVCDTQPSTIQRYSALLGVSPNETEANLCVYVSLYAVRYVVQYRTTKLKRSGSSSEPEGERSCESSRSLLRSDSSSRTKTYRFILRVDTLLAGNNWRWNSAESQAAAEKNAGEMEFVTNDFFAIEQRGENGDGNDATSTNIVTPASSSCPAGCSSRAPCTRMLTFADVRPSTSSGNPDASWQRSFMWNSARVEFDLSKWQPTTTSTSTSTSTSTTTRMASTTRAGDFRADADAAAIRPNGKAGSSGGSGSGSGKELDMVSSMRIVFIAILACISCLCQSIQLGS